MNDTVSVSSGLNFIEMKNAPPLHRELFLTSFPVKYLTRVSCSVWKGWVHGHTLRDRPDAPQPVQLLTVESLLLGKLNMRTGSSIYLEEPCGGVSVSAFFGRLWDQLHNSSEWNTLNLSLVLHIAPSVYCLHLSTGAVCPAGAIHQLNAVIDLDHKVINLTGNRGKYSYRHQGLGYNPFPSNL